MRCRGKNCLRVTSYEINVEAIIQLKVLLLWGWGWGKGVGKGGVGKGGGEGGRGGGHGIRFAVARASYQHLSLFKFIHEKASLPCWGWGGGIGAE